MEDRNEEFINEFRSRLLELKTTGKSEEIILFLEQFTRWLNHDLSSELAGIARSVEIAKAYCEKREHGKLQETLDRTSKRSCEYLNYSVT